MQEHTISVNLLNNQALYNAYKIIPSDHRKCLATLKQEYIKTQPYKHKRVIINAHITRSTLIMLELLVLAGAEVHVTATNELTVHTDALEAIKQAGIKFYSPNDIPHTQRNGYYDIVFDCGAGLINIIKPTYGAIELTHTENNIYSSITYPVISVDKSDTKIIETFFGTGNGFIRALSAFRLAQFRECTNMFECLENVNDPTIDTVKKDLFETNKFYVVFGYGKVGQGIAYGLLKSGVRPKNIIIIDKLMSACNLAIDHGKHIFSKQLTKANLLIIKTLLAQAFCIITATGRQNSISEYFSSTDFPQDILKINMGTPDEWGENFTSTAILNRKKAFNFSLEYPTLVKYLDPIFEGLLRAGEYIMENQLPYRLHSLATEIDQKIISNWCKKYSEINFIELKRFLMQRNLTSKESKQLATDYA